MSNLGDEIMPEITADWAREQSNKMLSNKVTFQLTECLIGIKEALENDNTYVYIYEYLHPKVISHLQSRGFTLEDCCSQKDGDAFKITW